MDFLKELQGLLDQVPPGRVTTFKALAEAMGDVRAARAIYEVLRRGRAKGWHRVVRSDGVPPFPEGVALLRGEGIYIAKGRVPSFDTLLFEDFQSRRPLERLREEQKTLAERIVLEDELEELRTVGGFDVSYADDEAWAAAVVLQWQSMEPVEEVALKTRVSFPYVSTYLAYREFEPIAECYRRLRTKPSLLLVDGNGILHPAFFGIACLVGIRLEKPTIGVAKSLLTGHLEEELRTRGQVSRVLINGRPLGYAYLPTAGGKPIYISPGHRVSPETAVGIIERLCKTRLPEPLRLADLTSRRLRRRGSGTFSRRGGMDRT